MKSQLYHNFWQRLHYLARNNGFPLRVMFELTYRCNFRCKHCYVPPSYRKQKELKTKEIFLILDQLEEAGCFYLGFTGGEPFLRKDIISILRYAQKKGFEVIIYTNGSFINEKIAQELALLRLNKVDITIPAMSRSNFEHITGASGSRDKVFRGIDFLRKNGINLGFKTCILKENESEIKEIQDFSQSLNALHRIDGVLSRRLNGCDEPYSYRGDKIENLLKQDGNGESCALLYEGRQPAAIDLFRCGVGVSQAAITPRGELKMCVMIDYPKYKILETSLSRCWQRLKDLTAKIKPDVDYRCDRCELKDFCKWCPAKAWLYNRSFTSCVPEMQQQAKRFREILKG